MQSIPQALFALRFLIAYNISSSETSIPSSSKAAAGGKLSWLDKNSDTSLLAHLAEGHESLCHGATSVVRCPSGVNLFL